MKPGIVKENNYYYKACMSIFSFFLKQTIINQKSLDILRKKGISPKEILSSIEIYNIDDVYGFLNHIIVGIFQFMVCEKVSDYLTYFTEPLNIIKEYEPILLKQDYKIYDYVFNITISKSGLRESCKFLTTEGVHNPITYLKKYQYEFFDTSKAHERIREKNEYLKNHSYLMGKKGNSLDFRIKSSWLNSLKTMEIELEIYKKCELIDYLLSNIKRFGYISEGEEKLKLFEKYNISHANRNLFLKKYFNRTLTRNCNLSQLEETLSHWHDT